MTLNAAKTGVWHDPYFKTLNVHGRLAYIYVRDTLAKGEGIILEDMTELTGLEFSEAAGYLILFINQGRLERQKVLDTDL